MLGALTEGAGEKSDTNRFKYDFGVTCQDLYGLLGRGDWSLIGMETLFGWAF